MLEPSCGRGSARGTALRVVLPVCLFAGAHLSCPLTLPLFFLAPRAPSKRAVAATRRGNNVSFSHCLRLASALGGGPDGAIT